MSQEDRLTGLVGFSGMKVPVLAATTAAITLSGEQTIDGIACVTNDRVLVKDQASGVNNGIYVVDTGDWTRAPDADGPFDFVFGSLTPVASGSVNGGAVFRLTTTGEIIPGTSSLSFSTLGLLSTPVPIASGGTGATTVVGAQANLLIGTQSTVASSATPDIWTGTGTQIDFTGSTGPVTGFAAAPRAGIWRVLVCASTPTFNNGANLILPASANYTAAAGDIVVVYALSTTQFRLVIFKADGTPVVGGSITNVGAMGFRLSLTTALPVTTSDVTAAGTLYCVPYKGKEIDLYASGAWVRRSSAGFSLALTLTSGSVYDVFCYDNAGTPTLETLVWTNATTRATALAYQDGVLVKSGDATRRYIGTLCASGSNTTEDSFAKRYLWNYYNRVVRPMRKTDTTDTWTYSAVAYQQSNAAAANQLDCVIGVSENPVTVSAISSAYHSATNLTFATGIGLDSVTVNNANLTIKAITLAIVGGWQSSQAFYNGFPGIGRHYFAWLEASVNSGTFTFAGDGGVSDGSLQTGIQGEVLG